MKSTTYTDEARFTVLLSKSGQGLALHAQIRSPQPLNSLIHQSSRDKLTREFDSQVRKLG